MEIKSNSWHWWMVKTFTDCDTAYDVDQLRNGCHYRRKFLIACLNAFLTTVVCVAVAVLMTSNIWGSIGYWLGWWGDAEEGPGVIMFISGVIWFLIFCAWVHHKEYHIKLGRWIQSKLRNMVPKPVVEKWEEPKPPREKTFIEQWISDVYHKICPTEVKLVDPDEEK